MYAPIPGKPDPCGDQVHTYAQPLHPGDEAYTYAPSEHPRPTKTTTAAPAEAAAA